MNAKTILDFMHRVGVLKSLPRTGWRMRGIRDGESVADHGYRLTHLAMLLADLLIERNQTINVEKVLRMAQLHEIGEAVIGDVPRTRESPFPEEAKRVMEEAAVSSLTQPLGQTGELYQRLWKEFEDAVSLEARLVKGADKLEMMIQALEYEQEGYRSLGEFWEYAAGREGFQDLRAVEEILELLEARRRPGQAGDAGTEAAPDLD